MLYIYMIPTGFWCKSGLGVWKCSSCILHKYKNVWSLKFWDFISEMFWHKNIAFRPQLHYLTDKSAIWVLSVEMLRNWLLYDVKLYKPSIYVLGTHSSWTSGSWQTALRKEGLATDSFFPSCFLLQYSTCA